MGVFLSKCKVSALKFKCGFIIGLFFYACVLDQGYVNVIFHN